MSDTPAVSPAEQYLDRSLAARLAKWVTGVVAAGLLLIGILGFIPGATSNFDQLALAGHGSAARLFGIFQVSVLHNAIHIASGVLGFVLAHRARTARMFVIGGGLLYLALAIYGLVVGDTSAANFIPVNTADDWLHLGLGLGMLTLGLSTLRMQQ